MRSFNVREYVEANLDRVKDSAGDEITATCPECGEWGAFYVNALSGAYVCFKCNWRSKTIVGLVALVEDMTWAEASKYIFTESVEIRRKGDIVSLAERLRCLILRDDWEDDEHDDEPVEFPLPKAFRACYKGGRWSLPEYLKERRIKSRTAREWGMGWCRAGRFAGRLVIPIQCPGGYSFTARDMTGEQEPKYLNPTGADHRRLLIGYNMANMKGDFCVVEGPLDAVRLYQHGFGAVAVGSTLLHSEQMDMLFSSPRDAAVTVMLDPEEDLGPYEVAKQLCVHFDRVYIAALPVGVDPGKASLREASNAVERADRFTGERTGELKARINKAKKRGEFMYEGKKVKKS
jgi:hypothetical protein